MQPIDSSGLIDAQTIENLSLPFQTQVAAGVTIVLLITFLIVVYEWRKSFSEAQYRDMLQKRTHYEMERVQAAEKLAEERYNRLQSRIESEIDARRLAEADTAKIEDYYQAKLAQSEAALQKLSARIEVQDTRLASLEIMFGDCNRKNDTLINAIAEAIRLSAASASAGKPNENAV